MTSELFQVPEERRGAKARMPLEEYMRESRNLGITVDLPLAGPPEPTNNGLRLAVMTDRGVMTLNCHRRTRVVKLSRAGRVRRIASIPEWLALKAGLIQ